MTRKHIGSLLLLLLLCACSGKDKYEPFTPLSKATISPEREANLQTVLNGGTIQPTKAPAPAVMPTDELFDMPGFDEDSFFAESFQEPARSGAVATEAVPFDEDPFPAQQLPEPTATPVPTVRVYSAEANQYMYGTTNDGQRTYTLQEGEDLICIARRFDVSIALILSQNQLNTPNEAKTGDVILLPRNPSPWALTDGYGRRIVIPHPNPLIYTTKAGENLFSIACSYGDVRPEDIAARNQLLLSDPLPAGTEIVIP